MAVKILKNKKGISLIEILIVVAIINIALIGFLGVLCSSLKVLVLVEQKNRADFLAQEALEIVRNFRDTTDWDVNGLGTLNVETAYHTQKSESPAGWLLILGNETINGFTRSIVFKNVFRDTNDNIVESGGVLDTDTKKIVVTVLWGSSKSWELVTYLTNWQQ